MIDKVLLICCENLHFIKFYLILQNSGLSALLQQYAILKRMQVENSYIKGYSLFHIIY